jgi:hypothetical protein
MTARIVAPIASVVLALVLSANSHATIILDFATDSNNDNTPDTTSASLTAGGVTALFEFADSNGGTGNIKSFVQIKGANNGSVERAYNTPVNNTLDNGTAANFNRNLQVSQLPIQVRNNIRYFEFLLDVNESAGGGDEFLSLDTIELYTTSAGSQSIDPVTGTFAGEVLRFDLDADMDNEILTDFTLNSGSGTIDLTLLVPVWSNPNPSDFVILYSEFGAKGTTTFNGETAKFGYSDGFEEWAVRTTGIVTVPEARAYLMMGLVALCVSAGYVTKRRG